MSKILAGELMRFRQIALLNILTLIGAISLLLGICLLAVLQFDVDNYWRVIVGGVIMLFLGLILLIFGVRIFLLNVSFIKNNSGVPSKHMMLGVYAPLVMAVIICIGSPIMYKGVENSALIRTARLETPLKRTIEDICSNLFRDPEYILQIPGGHGSYYKVGDNDHVLIWVDTTGDAYWFDTADSLSSNGYVCIRPGIPVQEAISNYESWTPQRDLINVFDSLYWWNK